MPHCGGQWQGLLNPLDHLASKNHCQSSILINQLRDWPSIKVIFLSIKPVDVYQDTLPLMAEKLGKWFLLLSVGPWEHAPR